MYGIGAAGLPEGRQSGPSLDQVSAPHPLGAITLSASGADSGLRAFCLLFVGRATI